MKKSSIICVTSATLLLLMGMAALLALPWILLKIIHTKLVLSPENESYQIWRDLPIPMYQKFYFFNVTNPREVQTLGHRPNLEQVGPFVFKLTVKKYDLNFTDFDRTVFFRENFTFYFDRHLSADDLSLKITTINAPLAVAMKLIEPLKGIKKTAAIILINILREDFFVDKTVGQLLFEGYPDLLTKTAPLLNPKIPYQSSFGWMYARNQTTDGLFSVSTGKQDISQVNAIETLDGSPDLSFWSGEACNSLKGAKNGELFNPIKSKSDYLQFFRTDLCRVWQMVYELEEKSRLGDLSVYRYYPSDKTFDNSSEYPPNSCYKPNDNQSLRRHVNDDNDLQTVIRRYRNFLQNSNNSEIYDSFTQIMDELEYNILTNLTEHDVTDKEPNTSDTFSEYPSGIFDMSVCHYGAPIFISKPHFFEADPYYLTTVTGLKPNSSLHQTFLDVEPITGIPVELDLKVQINVHIEPFVDQFKQYRKMPRIHIPVLWQEFAIHITDEIADKLHWQLTGPSLIAIVISSFFIVTGAITILVIASRPVRKWCAHRRASSGADDCDTSALIDDNTHVESNAISNGTQPVVS